MRLASRSRTAHGRATRRLLVALRIRSKGSAGKSLEEMLEADDVGSDDLSAKIAEVEAKSKGSLDDLLSKPRPKPEWPS